MQDKSKVDAINIVVWPLPAAGAGELLAHVPPEFDVKALRRKLGMSQLRFAASFGFGLAAVQSC